MSPDADPDPRPRPRSGPIPAEIPPDLWPLVPRYLENRRGELADLRSAVAEGDAEALEDLGHRLKGIGSGYGFDYITRAGAAMEAAGRAGRPEDARPWVDGLEDYLARVEPRKGAPET